MNAAPPNRVSAPSLPPAAKGVSREPDNEESERMPGVILHSGVPQRQHVGGEARLEAMRAEGAEHDRNGGEQCAGGEEKLHAGFLVFLSGRPGRFLP